MHRERAEDGGAGSNDEAEKDHGDGAGGALERRLGRRGRGASDFCVLGLLGGFAAGQSQPMQRQADRNVDRGEDQQCRAPAVGAVEGMADGPEHGGGKPAEQRQIGDRAAAPRRRHLDEGREGCVVEAEPHGDAEERPGGEVRRLAANE